MKFMHGSFYHAGKPLDSPVWGMTLLESGNMRFRWNEKNRTRTDFFESVCNGKKKVVQPELIHSKIVYDVSDDSDILNKQGDGVITRNRSLLPAVTVADCMPVFIYDVNSGTFGVLHSGWKGTGIIEEAFRIIRKKYSSRPEDICVVLGPHINRCCYTVDKNRAEYFMKTFSPDCTEYIDENKYSLSLLTANMTLLKRLGIPESNIFVSGECTCCFMENGSYKYGSFRRQTSSLSAEIPAEECQRHFTVQSAFVFAQ